MLAMQIIATLFVGISIFTCELKNNAIWDEKSHVIATTVWGGLWRIFVIVAIWIIPLLA